MQRRQRPHRHLPRLRPHPRRITADHDVVLGTVDTPTPGRLSVAILITPGSDAVDSEGGLGKAFASAPLPTEPVLLSLIRNDDPTQKDSGFFGEYSPSSHRGVIASDGNGRYTLPLAGTSSDDTTWAKETLGSGSLAQLGAAIAAATKQCAEKPDACLQRTAALG